MGKTLVTQVWGPESQSPDPCKAAIPVLLLCCGSRDRGSSEAHRPTSLQDPCKQDAG